MTGPIKRMLVYIDGTEEAITATEYSICLAKAYGASLSALYVVNTRALNDLVRSRIFLETEEQEYTKDLEEDAHRYLNHAKEIASAKGVQLETIKVNGAVHTEIKKCVHEKNIDLLVLGELSRIQSRRDEFYNETERAMRSVECSVLIVKDEDRVLDMYEELS